MDFKKKKSPKPSRILKKKIHSGGYCKFDVNAGDMLQLNSGYLILFERGHWDHLLLVVAPQICDQLYCAWEPEFLAAAAAKRYSFHILKGVC